MKNLKLCLAICLSLALAWLAGCARTPTRPAPQALYVTPPATYLRLAPNFDAPVVAALDTGTKLEFIEKDDSGWYKMRLGHTSVTGWIRKELLSDDQLPNPVLVELPENARPPVYYVVVPVLNLRAGPSNQSKIIKELPFTSKLEKLDETPQGWFQVREKGTDVAGWAYGRYLLAYMLKKPLPVKRSYPRKEKETLQETFPFPSVM